MSEPRQQAHKKTILSGVIFTTGANALVNVLLLATSILTFRLIGVEEYGYVALCLSVFQFGNYFIEFGFSSIFSSEIAKKRALGETGRAKYYLLLLGKIQTLTILTLSMALFLVRVPVAERFLKGPVSHIYPVIAYLLLYGIHIYMFTYFNSLFLFAWANLLRTALYAGRFAILIYLYWSAPPDLVSWIIWSYPLAVLISLALVMAPALKSYSRIMKGAVAESTPEMRRALWRQLKFGILLNPLKGFTDVAPTWILNAFTNLHAVGLFNFAIQIIRAIYSFLRAMETTLLPLIAHYHSESKSKRTFLTLRMTKYTLWAITSCLLVVIPAFPWIIRILVKDEYVDAVPYFRVMSLMLIPLVYIQVERPLLVAYERQNDLVYTDTILLAFILTAGFGLAYLFGLWGMVVLSISNHVLTVLIYWWFLKRREPDFVLVENPFRFDDWDRKNLGALAGALRRRLGR